MRQGEERGDPDGEALAGKNRLLLHFCFNDRFFYARKQMTLDVVTWKIG